ITQPNNAGRAMRGAAIVSRREALDSDDPDAAPRERMDRGAANDSKPCNDDIGCHSFDFQAAAGLSINDLPCWADFAELPQSYPHTCGVRYLFIIAVLLSAGGLAVAHEIPLPRSKVAPVGAI